MVLLDLGAGADEIAVLESTPSRSLLGELLDDEVPDCFIDVSAAARADTPDIVDAVRTKHVTILALEYFASERIETHGAGKELIIIAHFGGRRWIRLAFFLCTTTILFGFLGHFREFVCGLSGIVRNCQFK